ncbi:MAG: hypothetical protein ISQ95_01925 [Flavobacteriales bacterium]|nr:hypothetical protein [Flavobacteriales bacterium]
MKRILYTLLFLNQFILLVNAQDFSVGTWRDHLPYSKFTQVASVGDIIYAATQFSLVEFDNSTNEITKLSTVNGLSEIGISCISANRSQNALLVAYNSSNIDLIKNGEVINISSIINSSIIGDKTIYNLYSHSKYIYVCTGFGIVVVDLDKEEIKDTYLIEALNSQVKVKDIHISNDTIYALTENEIKYAPLNNGFLSNSGVWSSHSLPNGSDIDQLESFGDDLFAFGRSKTIFQYSNNQWDTLIYQPNENIRNFKVINENLIICSLNSIEIYDRNLQLLNELFAYNATTFMSPNDIIKEDGYYWIADNSKGFNRVSNNWLSDPITNGGPFSRDCFHLSSKGDQLYVASGRTDGTNWNKTYNTNGIYRFKSSWTTYNRTTNSIMQQEIDTISDIVWVTPNPRDPNKFVASSWSGGLLSFNNNDLEERFTFHNSSLQTRIGGNGYSVFVAGTCFDNNGNLWVANAFTTSPLSVKTIDGSWKSFYCGGVATNKLCTDLIIDEQYGFIWMAIKSVGILVYDFNQTPLDESDDQYKIIGSGNGTGSLPSTFVNTLAIDKDGEIWIGTDQGPVIFYSSYSIMNETTYDAQKILIEQDGTLQYLLENERITDIEIDGANRKWISTDGGGVFLLSEEGTQTIYSFSKNNSPLYSDVINSLAINDNTGEVYMGSTDGIIGFKSTATSSNIQFKTLEVFPNPVRPEYQGNIAIRGMMNNSEVKIVNASGFPVKTVFSNGGQAIWDGLDNNNQQVGSGVYYFLVTSEDGYSKAKSKVLIIR